MVLDGGPRYRLSPAVSLFVSCDDQTEVDRPPIVLRVGQQRQNLGGKSLRSQQRVWQGGLRHHFDVANV